MEEQNNDQEESLSASGVKTPAKIWVLADDNTGATHQAISLAQELGEKFEVKHFQYNCLAKLPNILLTFFPFHITKSSRYQLDHKDFPEIIISSGRKAAAIAVYLKEVSNKPVKIIQIMRPNLSHKKFELIILPQHDNFYSSLPNVVRIVGALTNIRERIADSSLRGITNAQEKFIVVMIGGTLKNYSFSLDKVMHLSEILHNVTINHATPLFISFSRRTPKNVKNYFKDSFPRPHVIYDPTTNAPNPYPAILDKAEYIICTTDSISMCSEAVSTGKPVYLFKPGHFDSKKHNFFMQQLFDIGVAKNLDVSARYLKKYEYTPLLELSRIAKLIREKLQLGEKDNPESVK